MMRGAVTGGADGLAVAMASLANLVAVRRLPLLQAFVLRNAVADALDLAPWHLNDLRRILRLGSYVDDDLVAVVVDQRPAYDRAIVLRDGDCFSLRVRAREQLAAANDSHRWQCR